MAVFLKKAEAVFRKTIAVFLIIVFGLMIALTAVQVISRYFFGASIPWTEEAVRVCMVYTVFIGSILVFEEHGHVCVTNFVDMMPVGLKKAAIVVSYLLQILFCILLFVGAMNYLPVLGSRTLNMFKVPMKLLYLCEPISAVCLLIFVIRDFVLEVFYGKEVYNG